MALDSLDLQEAHNDPSETWAQCIPQLKSEIASLTNLLRALSTEESDAQEQLESLTYALGLTKGELARRKRSNSELSRAYQTGRRASTSKPYDLVQKLEGELLNAKRDSANMEYEVERLEFRLKKLNEGDVSREPISPVVAQSPALRSPRMGIRSPMASPQTRQGRLIGDVDAVVCVDRMCIPCRVGVSVGGGWGLYTYDSAECLVYLDERVVQGDLLEADRNALKEWLRCVDVDIGEGSGVIVGLAEGVRACVQIVREVGRGIDDG